MQPALKFTTKWDYKSAFTVGIGCGLTLAVTNPSGLGFVVCVRHFLVPGCELKNSVEWSWVCQIAHDPCDKALQSVACWTLALGPYNPDLVCCL